jgi:hypothetical protein
LASASCAVIVAELPAATDEALDETRYFVGAPGVADIAPLVPVIAVLSVAVTACVVAVAAVVNVTVAKPDALVVEVGEPNEPPLELDHVIVLTAPTLLPLPSFS